MSKAVVAIHSAARRQPGYASGLRHNLLALGDRIELFETNWADLGDPATFGDAERFAAIRQELFRKAGVPSLAMRFIEPRGGDPTSSPGSAFDPILLYGFIADVRKQVQQRLRDQLAKALANGHESVTMAAHSMGSVVAFDLLAENPPSRTPAIDLFMTLGSPLWMSFFDARHAKKLRGVGSWMNLYHPQDFIGRALLPAFGDDGPCPPLDMPVNDEAHSSAPHSFYWTSPQTARAMRHAWQALTIEH